VLGSTMLTKFFDYCAINPLDTANITYPLVPEYIVWEPTKKQWKARQRDYAIGRVYFVQPREGERYYLRILLNTVPSPKSWEHLRTFDGVIHPTFKAACIARGLLESDEEFDICLTEAATFQTGSQLRHLSAMIVLHNSPAEVGALFERHFASLTDDCRHQLINRFHIANPNDVQIKDFCLLDLKKVFSRHDKTLAELGLPVPSPEAVFDEAGRLVQEELGYNQVEMQAATDFALAAFNLDQRSAYNTVMAAVEGESGVFFLQGPGGTGKTFVENSMLAGVRQNHGIALAVASSGIAALLLRGGRTAHSRFKIPLECGSDTVLSISKQGELAELLKQASLIIWDEAPMQHRYTAEAVSRSLQDLRDDPRPFGGVTTVFGGDWAQTLPIIPNASEGEIVGATLPSSTLWNDVSILRLETNMRLQSQGLLPQERVMMTQYADWLKQLGRGQLNTEAGHVELPQYIKTLSPTQGFPALISNIFPQVAQIEGQSLDQQSAYFGGRAILAARNDSVDAANQAVLDLLPGNEHSLKSADCLIMEGEELAEGLGFPQEYLNSLTIPGLPLHDLRLKVGAPIILLRNLDAAAGLCNGTRLLLLQVGRRCLQARILMGDHRGKTVLIPRIALDSVPKALPVKFRRLQFPVRLAFALTINKVGYIQ
jgi:ATP-dependent DNA helicase PIF1